MLAALLGVLVLTSSLGTWSGWQEQVTHTLGDIQAGSVSMSGTSELQLLSRQPVGTRTYLSTASCPATAPYVECRVVTDTLPSERVVPGDTVQLIRTVTLTGEGNNLTGDLVFDAGPLVNQAPESSLLSRSAVVTLGLTRPNGSSVPVSGLISTVSISPTAGQFGTYTAVALIQLPVDNAGARWEAALTSQTLDLGTLKTTFSQTN